MLDAVRDLFATLDRLHAGHGDCVPEHVLIELDDGDPPALLREHFGRDMQLVPIADWRGELREGIRMVATTCGKPKDHDEVELLGGAVTSAIDAELAAPITGYRLRGARFGYIYGDAFVLVDDERRVFVVGLGWSD